MQLVLLSGGSGKRLWPLSNNARSKQFLPLLEKENGYRVQYIEVDSQTIAVDTPNDLKRVIEYFKEHNIE